jgi:hypothetical protein
MNDLKEKSNIKMNAITYNTLIDLFVRCNHMDQV